MVFGSVTFLQGQDRDRYRQDKLQVRVEFGDRNEQYGHNRYERNRYDRNHRDYRHMTRHQRRILKKIQHNERRIYKYERKIRELRHRARYSRNYRHYHRSIRHYKHKIYRLQSENRLLRRQLRGHQRGRTHYRRY